mgnify:CR=1 FL=1
MRKLILYFSLFLVMCSTFELSAQEKLYDLKFGKPQKEVSTRAQNTGRINVLKHPFIYVLDTLDLPFFDDFTTDKIKRYNANKNDANVSLKINYDFSVNTQNPESLEYMIDTTYSILRTAAGEVIESANPTLFISLYEEGKVVGRDTGWTNLITEFDQSSGLVTYDTLVAERLLINYPDTFYRVADDYTLWSPTIDTFDSSRSAPMVNNTFAKNPVTQGVVTFDGTDDLGNPYDNTSETTYGLCDILESKPLALDSNMENVFLSFFYQAGGNGNLPEEEDSLVLEFFDIADSTWRFAWKAAGPEVEDTLFSDQVFLQIDGRKYLQPGFRFRFKNYATQSGNLDHWHIDYVRMGRNRDTIAEDTTLNDVAFISGISSFITPYTSAPYSHYISDPSFFDASEVSVVNSNLSSISLVLNGLRYEIYDPSENLIQSETTVDPNISPNTVRKTDYPISNTPIFPDLATESAEFPYLARYTSTGVGNTYNINDTIHGKQFFGDYYSYDDGSAEKAYALTGAGVKLAYEFNAPIGDSLRAMLFNFPRMLHNDNEDLTIELIVWDDLLNDPIYTAELLVEPNYTNADEFFRIPLDNPLFVEGKFYLGYRQNEATKIYIGYDVNTNNSDRLNYQIGETWYTSAFSGSLLLRADFGKGEILGIENKLSVNQAFTIYPNPANNEVHLKISSSEIESVQLFDISGRSSILSLKSENKLDLSGLSNGAYFIRVITADQKTFTQKLIVSH